MICPNCGEDELEIIEIDNRQERVMEEYMCPTCDKTFYREIVFKTQSSQVESDILYDEDWKEVR